ncbi:MAG TPA: tetratricopeptide repeat protein [Blastocatellia bacterium]|nr:tetratricopeptide repeat protein [Blastocatellia bacterium]
MFKRFIFALFIALSFTAGASAQEVDVDRYDITVNLDPATSALDARAAITVSNLSQTPKPKLYLRLTKLAKVGGATVAGATAQVETIDDRRVTTLNQIVITPPAPLAAGASARVEVSYRIEVPESTALASIYQGEAVMLPEAVWFPMPSTPFTMYGPTTAPFTLTVNVASNAAGFRAASAGAAKSEGQRFIFEQPLNSLPFFIATSFDQPAAFEHGGVKVEIYTQPGLVQNASSSAVAQLTDEAKRIIDFLTKTMGPPPSGASFRVISSARAANVAVAGAVVLSQQSLRQDRLNAATIEVLADALARVWTDGRVRLRGQEARAAQAGGASQKARSIALLRDSLPRYLAALYFEDRYGKDAGREAFSRFRWTYTPVAKSGRDAELGIQTILIPTYSQAVLAKGPLVLRLMAETIGRDKFIAALRALFAGPQTKVVTPDDFRQSLVKAQPEAEKLYQQWVETIVEPDIVIGIPQPTDRAGVQRINVRNLGTGEVATAIVVTTESGKQMTVALTVPSENITSTDIQTAEKISAVEIDPEKLAIQTDYDNDRKPAVKSAQTLFNESILAFNKGQHAEAEINLREAVRVSPNNSLVRAWLARALAAQNKADEAVREANAAIKIEPAGGSALAWAHITLGQIALGRNQAAEAVEHLRRAAIEAEEAPAQFAARELLVRAVRAASAPPVEESVRAFVAQLDSQIKQPSSEKLSALVIRNNLKRFVQGLTLSPPTAWTTEILRADRIDANRVALDVGLKVRAEGRDQSGTALFILHRSGAGWVLEDVQLFNVK